MGKHKKNKHKNNNKKTNILPSQKTKKHKTLKTIITIIIILILAIAFYNYIQFERKKYYLLGGKDAINIILEDVKQSGGVLIKLNNEEIRLAKYNKITQTTNNETQQEET